MSDQDNNNYNGTHRSDRGDDNHHHEDSIERRKADRRELEDLDRRFGKIESKITELTEAVIAIARAEEKITRVMETQQDMKNTINNHTNRLHDLELNESKNSTSLKMISGLSWTILGGIVTAVAGIVISIYMQ